VRLGADGAGGGAAAMAHDNAAGGSSDVRVGRAIAVAATDVVFVFISIITGASGGSGNVPVEVSLPSSGRT
jgi:hypothetical protein